MACPPPRPAKRPRLLETPCGDDSAVALQPCLVGYQTSSVQQLIAHSNGCGELTQYEPATEASKIVCYGTIPSMGGRCDRPRANSTTFPVCLESSERFASTEDSRVRGLILPHYGQMIQGLLDEKTLILHVSCTADSGAAPRRSKLSASQVPCALDITVYGPIELFEEIGEWFQEYNIYLQDPRACHLNVRYCNPQRLSSGDLQSCPFVSQIVSRSSEALHFQDVVEQPDLLDIISEQDDLEEAEAPTAIQAVLHRHQKQALTFMLRREAGWDLDGKAGDIWEALDSSHDRIYINRVTDAHQKEAPPQFCGGIIADPMGLGKTLTMIALAAMDLERPQVLDEDWDSSENGRRPVAATLIIVPQPLLSTWEQQLFEHVENGRMRCRRHHGKTRLNNIQEIDDVNMVLTTYHTLSADWKSWNNTGDHTMFSVHWRRIVLDEAHLIRNVKTRMARAIYELESHSRWAVTGTPIQNHLSDLAALLKFIRAHPYDDSKRFDTDVSRLWKSGEDEEAVKRLKRLSRCLILRRAKRTINLPARRDVKCPVDFNKDERALYENVRHHTITKIDDALHHDTELSRSGIYINFLQQIESMRLICNLGLHYHERHDMAPSQQTTQWTTVAQEAFNIQRDMHPISCSQCSSSLEMTESLLDDSLVQESPQFSRCLKYACAECCHKLHTTGHKMVCGHTPRCPVASVSISSSMFEEAFSQLLHCKSKPAASVTLPSKVEALISDLKSLPYGVKSIVFSTWRLTLDIIELGLNQCGIRSVRFDGKVSQAQRQPVLNQFKADPNIRVMLLTLQCGAVGLTLTEASRAYLMEPHWNPTIEEQALARIHRIGQICEVTTIRFYIRDSFEERVMEVQESKKNLAGVLLSGHDGGQADDSVGALQRLRSLL